LSVAKSNIQKIFPSYSQWLSKIRRPSVYENPPIKKIERKEENGGGGGQER